MKLKHLFIFLISFSLVFITILGTFRFTAFDLGDTETTNNLEDFLKNKKAGSELIEEFAEEEQEHLFEVRAVMHTLFGLLNFAVIIYMISMFSLFFIEKKEFVLNLGRSLFYGGIASLSTVFVFFITSLFFNKTFIIFHKLFFRTQWQFPADHLLIQLFPIQFFISKFAKILLISFIISLLVGTAGFLIKEKYINKKKIKR